MSSERETFPIQFKVDEPTKLAIPMLARLRRITIGDLLAEWAKREAEKFPDVQRSAYGKEARRVAP
jgi:hypothetical protein